MQLLQSTPDSIPRGRVLIGDFSSAENVEHVLSNDATAPIRKQLQHSMLTLLTQAGFDVIALDGKSSVALNSDNSIKITPNTHMQDKLYVDYILTGTLIAQQHAYLVNTKLVSVAQHSVAAAATSEIPLNVLWSREQVQLKNGRLHRIEL
ncbi:FlgO family outer membrane protein [Rheinheimera gaetbuli]